MSQGFYFILSSEFPVSGRHEPHMNNKLEISESLEIWALGRSQGNTEWRVMAVHIFPPRLLVGKAGIGRYIKGLTRFSPTWKP